MGALTVQSSTQFYDPLARAESTAVLRVPSSTHSRHLVTSRRVRAQVSESRRTARAPALCPRVRCLSLCPARILAVPRVPRGRTVFSSVLTWTPQFGEFERISDRPVGTTSIQFPQPDVCERLSDKPAGTTSTQFPQPEECE